MIRYQIAARYAMALFKSPCSKEALKKRLRDLEEIEARIDENPKFPQYLYAPEIPIAEKEVFIKKILSDDVDPLLLKFLFFLLKKKRINCLSDIAKIYRKLVDESLGILDVDLITAIPLDQSEKEALKLKIAKFNSGKEISLFEKIDPKIIGGMIVIIDHRIIDLSVKNTLAQMKEQLLAAPV